MKKPKARKYFMLSCRVAFVWVNILLWLSLTGCGNNTPAEKTMADSTGKYYADYRSLITGKQYPEAISMAKKVRALAIIENNIDTAALYTARIARNFRLLKTSDSAMFYYRLAKQMAVDANLSNQIYDNQAALYELYYDNGLADSLEKIKEELVLAIDSTKLEKLKMRMTGQLGIYYATHNESEKALTCFFKKLEYDQKGTDSLAIGTGLMHVGRTYMTNKQPARAVSYLLQSVPYFSEKVAITPLNLAGTIFNNAGNNDSARLIHHRAIASALKFGDSSQIYNTYLAFSESLVAQELYDSAASYLKPSLIYFLRTNYLPSVIDIYTIYASIEQKKKNPSAEAGFLLKALEYARGGDFRDWELYIYETLADAAAGAGNYKDAWLYQKKFMLATDSVRTESNQRSMAEMETRYRTTIKEQEIKTLNQEISGKEILLKAQHRNQLLLAAAFALAIVTAIFLYRSIRLKKKSGQLLEQRNKALEEANEAKARLFSIISHDLRSPVSSLFNLLEVERAKGERDQASNDRLQNTASRVLEAMDEILLWSKSQLDSFSPLLKETSIPEIMEDLTDVHAAMIASKGLELEVISTYDGNLLTDVNLLKTVIRNVIGNSVRFTPENGIIRVNVTQQDKMVAISITDSGPGFSMYVERESLINSNSSGYGLLLAKEIMEKLGGSVTIEHKKTVLLLPAGIQ